MGLVNFPTNSCVTLRGKLQPRIANSQDDICDATQNLHDAGKALAEQCDLVIAVGSPNSSNSRRLKEVAAARGIDGCMVDGPEEIEPAWPAGKWKIGITAGGIRPGNPWPAGGRPRQCVDQGRSRATGRSRGRRVVPATEGAGVTRSG